MDHLPQPSHATKPAIKVPYVCKPEDVFDGLEFSGFVRRRGWDENMLLQLELGDKKSDDVSSIIQSWLFFGVLQSVITVPFEYSLFVDRTIATAPILTTKALPAVVREWKAAWSPAPNVLEGMTEETKSASLENILVEARRISDIFEKANSVLLSVSWPPGNKCIVPESIVLSIEVLLSCLSNAAVFIFGLGKVASVGSSGHLDLRSFGLFDDWCPYAFARASAVLNSTAMYFVGRKPLYGISKPHVGCDEKHCTAEFVDEDNYDIAHVCRTNDCALLGLDEEEVERILANDDFPIVILEQTSPDTVARRVVPSNVAPPYIAISHVWSHGLGNPLKNAMPQCQLQRLHDVSRVALGPTTVALWVDTLCVPLKEEPQKLAIAKMRSTYRDAQKVLILDQGLSQVSCLLPPVEILSHVACSTWLQRLWTFQEGALAKKLIIQLSGGQLDYDLLLQQVATNLEEASYETVSRELINACQTMRIISVPDCVGPNLDFALWINAIQRRRTTAWEDESICLATLLGHDLRTMVRSGAEKRMMAIYRSQVMFPFNIVFSNHPKMTENGFKWAPATWLQSDLSKADPGDTLVSHPMSFTARFFPNDGLVMDLPSYKFQGSERVTIPMMFGDPSTHFVYVVASTSGTTYHEWTPENFPDWTGRFALLFETRHEISSGKILAAVLVACTETIPGDSEMAQTLSSPEKPAKEISAVHYLHNVCVAFEPRFGRTPPNNDAARAIESSMPVSRFCIM